MGKVIRADKSGVQKVRAREIVPGDIVEVSGKAALNTLTQLTGRLNDRWFEIWSVEV